MSTGYTSRVSFELIFLFNLYFFLFHVASTRFVKCEKCHHFFVVLSELDSKRSMRVDQQTENDTSHPKSPKAPPPPRKVNYFYKC